MHLKVFITMFALTLLTGTAARAELGLLMYHCDCYKKGGKVDGSDGHLAKSVEDAKNSFRGFLTSTGKNPANCQKILCSPDESDFNTNVLKKDAEEKEQHDE